jgi:Cu2+-exporting ATPase
MSSASLCQHCGTPVPAARTDGFCCAGCACVFQMLHTQGFEHFYDLKADQMLPPVMPQALREQDYRWLETLVEAQSAPHVEDLVLSVQGLSCMGCIWLIEKLFTRLGGSRIGIDMTRGELSLSWTQGALDVMTFARELQQFGYLLGPRRTDMVKDTQLERLTGVCGAFAMNAMAFSLPAYFGMPQDFAFAKWFDLIAAMSATLSLLVGGSYFARRSWQSLRLGVLHIDTPITLGILSAYLGSLGGWLAGVPGLKYFDFVAMFIFLMLGGRWLQQVAVARNRRRLVRDPSISDTVQRDGEPVPVATLKSGDVFEIAPGQALPVAAMLKDDAALVSLEWINGESEAQIRRTGEMLPSGALNIGRATISASALETWQQSTLRHLLEARRQDDRRDLRLERLLRFYLIAVVIIGIVGAAAWWLSTGDIWKALQVMISIFVVSCPCALGVAAPLADDIAASHAGRLGIFVRSLGLWKKLSQVRQVVFDKTGTLTFENPELQDPQSLGLLDISARHALRHLVSGNLHPVSRSLFDALALETDPHTAPVDEAIGLGLSFLDDSGTHWWLGKPDWEAADVVFKRNDVQLAAFRFADQLRPESAQEVKSLQQRGCAVFILSGDRREKVAETARRLDLAPDRWLHGLTPRDKADWVVAHDASHTLYIGDGANDSLAFDAALCAGSPVTGRSFLEAKADFYFLGHSLRFVGGLLGIARTHRRAVHRVFAFALTYNILTVIAGLMGALSPLAAAVLMPLSSLATLSLVALTFRAPALIPLHKNGSQIGNLGVDWLTAPL